jgi:hypothetical protein
MPVPKVFRTSHVRGSLYIEMEFIRGTDLREAWLGGYLSTQVKEDIMRQLAGFVEQLSNGSPRPPTLRSTFLPVLTSGGSIISFKSPVSFII